jgi:hypothetical protein
MDEVLSDRILDRMRTIGDPVVDEAVEGLKDTHPSTYDVWLRAATTKGLSRFLRGDWLQRNAARFAVSHLLDPDRELPEPLKVTAASQLFARYGSEIAAALLLAALPESYASGRGAKTLLVHSALGAGGTVSTRRIQATAQFVISVLTPGVLGSAIQREGAGYTTPSYGATTRLWSGPDGQALRYAVALRIMHSLIRNAPPEPDRLEEFELDLSQLDDIALNQEDLLATLLTFSVTVFEVLDHFGIGWTDDEQEAYFHVWDHVGETLGIGDVRVIREVTGAGSLDSLRKELRDFDEGVKQPPPGGLFERERDRRVLHRIAARGTLRPRSVAEARDLLGRLRERMWTLENDRPPIRRTFDYENFKAVLGDISAGRVLLRALLDEVSKRLPPSQKNWPLAVMRQLVPVAVQNRLALGGTSSFGLLSTRLACARESPGLEVLSRLSAGVLRHRATQVADSLFLGYLNEGKLVIPGLDASVLGYGK